MVVSVVLGDEQHTDTGRDSCTSLAELTLEIFLKLPKGLIIFPSQSTFSAILVGNVLRLTPFLEHN